MIAAIRRGLPAARYPALALATLALVFFGWRATHGTVAGGSAPGSGPAAPAFELARLDGGGSVGLAEHSRRPLVVNFWASWCGPCEDEVGALERAWQRWSKRGVEFVGIDSRDSDDAAQAFVERYGITYPIAVDPDGEVAQKYGVLGMPQTFVISSDGRIASRTVGPITEAKINGLLSALSVNGAAGSPD
jgi:cytochrome c biogenesis protein CcmG, thiol:disulfide interchange protein DsbE